MHRKILFVVSFLALGVVLFMLAGCGSPTSSGSSNSLTDAINSDPGLLDVGSSDTSYDNGISVSGVPSQGTKCKAWKRVFESTSGISIHIISSDASLATVEVTRTVTGILYVKMASTLEAPQYESFKQDFARYITLALTRDAWKIRSVTQGITRSVTDSAYPYNSFTSDITIDSVAICDLTSGQTFEVSQDPSAAGPWIDSSNILRVSQSDVIFVTVEAEQIGHPLQVPFVFIWPEHRVDTIHRHQLTYSGGTEQYTYSFTVPSDEPLTGTKHRSMTLGAFANATLASGEAIGAYDFSSWHIPYKVVVPAPI